MYLIAIIIALVAIVSIKNKLLAFLFSVITYSVPFGFFAGNTGERIMFAIFEYVGQFIPIFLVVLLEYDFFNRFPIKYKQDKWYTTGVVIEGIIAIPLGLLVLLTALMNVHGLN